MVRRSNLAAAALLVAGLSACSRSPADHAPVENAVGTASDDLPAARSSERSAPMPSGPIEREPPEAPPAAVSDNASAELPVGEPATPTVDQQVSDDAAATGMTARASRGEEPMPDAVASQNEAK